jgi:hypothetical protein
MRFPCACGQLPLRLKRKFERRLLSVPRGDRHIAEGDEVLVDGGLPALGMSIMRELDLRGVAIDTHHLELDRLVALLERTLPVAEQIALVIDPLVEG